MEAVENHSLTMPDLATAASGSYAESRKSLERRVRVRKSQGITYEEADLIFESEESPFPWWIPEGVSWLDYLFGTYIRMRIALFPERDGRPGQRSLLLACQKSELGDAPPQIARLVERLERERGDELYARSCRASLVAP